MPPSYEKIERAWRRAEEESRLMSFQGAMPQTEEERLEAQSQAFELMTIVRGKIRGFNRNHRHSFLQDAEAEGGYHRSRRLKHPLRALFIVVLLLMGIAGWCLHMAQQSRQQWLTNKPAIMTGG